MKRPQTALLLVLAFLLALIAPVRATWSCPDGTLCVQDRSQGYVCASKQCSGATSCCVAKTVRCQHGAWPGLASQPSGHAEWGVPDHCRFAVTAPPSLTALAEQSGKVLVLAPALLPAGVAVQSILPHCTPIWRDEQTLGYRPPPLLSLGPSRAPPLA